MRPSDFSIRGSHWFCFQSRGSRSGIFASVRADLLHCSQEPQGEALAKGRGLPMSSCLTTILRSTAKLMALRTGTGGFPVHGRKIYWGPRKKPSHITFFTTPLGKALPVPFTICGRSTNRILVGSGQSSEGGFRFSNVHLRCLNTRMGSRRNLACAAPPYRRFRVGVSAFNSCALDFTNVIAT